MKCIWGVKSVGFLEESGKKLVLVCVLFLKFMFVEILVVFVCIMEFEFLSGVCVIYNNKRSKEKVFII